MNIFPLRRNQKKKNGRYPESEGSIIHLKEVTKVYEMGGRSFTALDGISLTIREGEFVSVIGKSGSGKSTLLNMITGIDRPSMGEVFVSGTAIHHLNENQMAIWRGAHLGIVFQFFQLLPTLTILENILLPMDFCKKFPSKERRERALSLLEEVDLLDQAKKLPATLSGGQQQRVAIVRALANDPPLLIADEPTGNLDSKTAETIFNLFYKLVDQGKTVLTVTHDRDLAEKATRTIQLTDGVITSDEEQLTGDTLSKYISGTESNIHVDLVKSGYEYPTQRSGSDIDSSLNAMDYDEKVREILNDHENATRLLREEFFKVSHNEGQMEKLYISVVNQVQYLAQQAEEEDNPEEAKRLWKTIMEATEPWARQTEKE